jgi:HAD superfamily hydrolase (TIGR01459 family)
MKARAQGIETVFLSNAPRSRHHVRGLLIEMGVPDELTNHIVTSGGLARDHVRTDFAGARLYHLGPETDSNTVEDLNIQKVDHPDDAEVIFATGLDFNDVKRHQKWLEGAAANKTPFLCANPDRIVHVGDKLYNCAGAVADVYAELGGDVVWFGKPTTEALKACLRECGMDENTSGRSILMVGDSLQTDIAGANAAGFKSLFIAGGIHRTQWPDTQRRTSGGILSKADFHEIFGAGKPVPEALALALL